MTSARSETFDWIERPRGSLGREDLHRLAERLDMLPPAARSILLDCCDVTHFDFRGVAQLVARLKALHARGVMVRLEGLDRYLLSILLLSGPTEEELEGLLGPTRRAQRRRGHARPVRRAADARWWLEFPISTN